MIDALKEDDPNALMDALKNLKKTVRDMNKAPVKDEPNFLAGKSITINSCFVCLMFLMFW